MIDKFEDLEVLNFPLRVGNIAFVIFFSLIFSFLLNVLHLMGSGGFIWSVPLVYVSFIFFFSYLFVIVDYTAQGYQKIPPLSAEMVATERPLLFKELVLISIYVFLLLLIDNAYWRVVSVISCFILFPIVTSTIIIE